MGKIRGFLEFDRKKPAQRPVAERTKDFAEFDDELSSDEIRSQGARCMDCGIPFCHTGCPLGNQIPDFNDQVYRGNWQGAFDRLSETNNFPEITGRICPAPCEEACTLNLTREPVNIKLIERQIASEAAKSKWIVARPASKRSGKRVAVVGSGPAGLACAQQLARAGHDVTVFERDEKPGGLLRYGIPDFKLDKSVIDRRIAQMEAEGVHFRCGVEVGKTIGVEELRDAFQGVVLAGGSTIARELPIEGRQAQGVHLAMDFLSQQNRVCDGSLAETTISAKGKHVVVLGGGDTGADCVGTSIRQGCASVTQIELMPRPSEDRPESMPWPYWPMILRTSSSHDEGAVREWSIMTKRFISDDAGQVRAISAVKVELVDGKLQEVADSQFEIRADLVFLALGFVSPQKAGLLESLAVNLDARGNVAADKHFKTSVPGVFACGDMRRGQSLVVWAIWEGRQAAAEVDAHLMGRSYLPVMNHTAPLEL